MTALRRVMILLSLAPVLVACDGDQEREQRMILDQASKLEATGLIYEARASYESAMRIAPKTELGQRAKGELARMNKKMSGP